MVRGRSTPVILGGHFHVTRFGMFRSRAGLALNPCQRQPVHGLPTGTGPSPHSKSDIRTAPPSRSRVKNDYSLIGMLSSRKNCLVRFFSSPPRKLTGLAPHLSSFQRKLESSFMFSAQSWTL